MEPDRKLCKFCGVELPFYLGPDDLCPRCKGLAAIEIAKCRIKPQ